jgi:RNA polymerase sigma factor (sigma-70 family)
MVAQACPRELVAPDALKFEDVYRAHVGELLRRARALTSDPLEAEDWVAETFTRTLSATRHSSRHIQDVRAYLFATLRSVRVDAFRRPSPLPVEEVPEEHPDFTVADPTATLVDESLAASAFHALPPRWQQVLRLTTVEDKPLEQVAGQLGITSGAAAVLAFRAREGLRTAYLEQWVPPAAERECAHTRARLVRWVRGRLAAGARSRVDLHLDRCDRCAGVSAALVNESSRMRSLPIWLLVPAAVGGGALGGAPSSGATQLAEVKLLGGGAVLSGVAGAILVATTLVGPSLAPTGAAPATGASEAAGARVNVARPVVSQPGAESRRDAAPQRTDSSPAPRPVRAAARVAPARVTAARATARPAGPERRPVARVATATSRHPGQKTPTAASSPTHEESPASGRPSPATPGKSSRPRHPDRETPLPPTVTVPPSLPSPPPPGTGASVTKRHGVRVRGEHVATPHGRVKVVVQVTATTT